MSSRLATRILKSTAIAAAALALAGATVLPASAQSLGTTAGATTVHNGTPTLSVTLEGIGAAAGSSGWTFNITATNHTGAGYQHFAPSIGILSNGLTAANAHAIGGAPYIPIIKLTSAADSTLWTDPAALDQPLADGQTAVYTVTVITPTTVFYTLSSVNVSSQATADGRFVIGNSLDFPAEG